MRRITVIKRIAPLLLLLSFIALPLYAQQVGASIAGHITDPSGAAVAGAAVTATGVTTGTVFSAGSDTAGLYQLPFIPIGEYVLRVTKQGFEKYEQRGIVLLANQKNTIDVTLRLGSTTQVVNVTGNAPILQTASGDRDVTFSSTQLDPETFRGQNTITSTWLIAGVTQTSAAQKERPWDNAGVQDEEINGGQSSGGQGGTPEQGQSSGNQVMVNGISINRGGNGTGYSPMASAVEQVAVETTMFDAQYGWTTGGAVDTIVKSGNNQWHGHGYDYLQNTILNAEDWGDQESDSGRPPWHFNYFGGEVGGPVKKDKMFAYFAYQLMWSIQKDPYTGEVPTAAMRQGNFNGLCSNTSGNCDQIQLYDPSTLTDTSTSTTDPNGCYYTGTASAPVASGFNPCRSQTGALFSAPNVINSAAISPIAKNVLGIIPEPWLQGASVPCGTVSSAQTFNGATVCGTFAGNISNRSNSRKFVDYFPEYLGRYDWNLSDKTHAFFILGKNDLAETRSYIYSTTSAINQAEVSGNNPLFRGNQFYDLDVTHTFNPTTVLELRTGMDRYPSGGGDITIAQTDPTSLGFSQNWFSEAAHFFPEIEVTGMGSSEGGQMAGGTLPSYDASDIWTQSGILAHTHGRHDMRIGWQRFDLVEANESPGNLNGYFSFTGLFTSQNPLGPVNVTGYGVADFLLGYPQTAYVTTPAYPYQHMTEEDLFFQDNFHVSQRLTLNLGLRWDFAGPVHDKYNRFLNGFCYTCANPLGTAGTYTNALGQPATVGALLGGPTYEGVGGSGTGITNRMYDNLGPRFGFAYDLHHDSVIRGGYGIIYGQQEMQPGAAPGYTTTTSAVTVPGFPGIFNPNISFANPIPSGLIPIAGNSYGLAANVGSGITFYDPNTDLPRTQQYAVEIQHRIGKDWLFSVAYVGSRATRLDINRSLNYLPLSDEPYLPNGQVNANAPGGGGAATYSFLQAQVKNPFIVPAQYQTEAKGTFLENATVSQQQLLYPYPEFSTVTEDWDPIGRSNYNGLQVEVNKRISRDLTFNANVTWSKTLQALDLLNPQDTLPRQTRGFYDMPLQFKLNFTYFVPFGPGQRWLNQSNGVISRFVSGWTFSATPALLDGIPAIVPSGLEPIPGAKETTADRSLSHAFNTCYLDTSGNEHDCAIDSTPAWQQTQPGALYEWDPAMHYVRYWGQHRLDADVMKTTVIKERYTLIYRADFINAFNSSEWDYDMNNTYTSSAFGYIGPPANTPSDDPRVIQMSLQFRF